MRHLFFTFRFFLFIPVTLTFPQLCGEEQESSHPTSQELGAASSPRLATLIVQPVILRDQDGTHPARHAIPQKLIQQAYSRANLQFLYLAPVYWNHSKARQGEINLNTIVTEGQKQGIISKDPSVLTLLFVSAVDGRKGPLGRGLQKGNICFVCLGPQGKMSSPAKQAFVVAHEIGHCLGLRHVVDDPAVPNDIPNLEGEGAFDERIAPEGLHPTQVATVQSSPLYHPHLHFLSPPQATRQLLYDTWNNNPESLRDNELRFQLGLPLDTIIPDGSTHSPKRKVFLERHFSQVSLKFTDREKKILQQRVHELEQLLETSRFLGGENNLISRLPWNFIKVKSDFCSGYPHTRGLNIILTGAIIKEFENHPSRALTLLLHEKTHIAQRLSPAVFQSAYHRYGFKPAQLAPGERHRLKILSNPDAAPPAWALSMGNSQYLLTTSLIPTVKDFAFKESYYPLSMTPNGNVAQDPMANDAEQVEAWKKKFPIQTGFDDPREIQAHLIGALFEIDVLKSPSSKPTPDQIKTLDQERKHLPELFLNQNLTPHL